MSSNARFSVKNGSVAVTREGIAIPHTCATLIRQIRAGGFRALRARYMIPAAEVTQVQVTGRDRQYMTGNRAAGAVLTGGVALLAPSRMRGALVIGTSAGQVFAFTLKRSGAKQPETVAAKIAAFGYTVS